MDAKGKVLLQLFNKSKLRNGTKNVTRVKFKKLGSSARVRFKRCFYYLLVYLQERILPLLSKMLREI